jgi:hypothetical protein
MIVGSPGVTNVKNDWFDVKNDRQIPLCFWGEKPKIERVFEGGISCLMKIRMKNMMDGVCN